MPHQPCSRPVRIRLHPQEKSFEVARGTPLQEVLFGHGVEFPCGGQGRCKGCRVRVLDGTAPMSQAEKELLEPAELSEGWRLACKITAETDLTLEIRQWESAILTDHTRFKHKAREGLGVAVDLGTTTLAAQLLDLSTADVLAVRTGLNPQAAFGADVMSRVQFSLSNSGKSRLCDIIRERISDLIAELRRDAGIARLPLADVVIVGNSVMHHLFCGIDAAPLAHYPFVPLRDELEVFDASSLGWTIPGNPMVRFLPCLGGFVGSDVLAGIIATGMPESRELDALIDLGTNGEIVLGRRGQMMCASTAAGPAFEGARIRMGMQATTGAVAGVEISGGALRCRVLGGGPARGICGSGLVDAVAVGLQTGAILPSGRLARGKSEWELMPGIALCQNDIRELQLAKGAIAAAIRLLLRRWGASVEDIRRVCLAGAFGNYIDRSSARRIGLFDFPVDRIEPAGNTALLGAKIVLCNAERTEDFADLRRCIEHVPLAADPLFEETFAECMSFPDAASSD
ncbi:MAG: DUF4445 domain-containing protein [Acidobacteria bacterium]|nr:DUF4445 domain-containing protein [Acidobacteriota bacterium]